MLRLRMTRGGPGDATMVETLYVCLQDFQHCLIAAASVVQIVPPVVFTLFMQRHIVAGLTMGAVRD